MFASMEGVFASQDRKFKILKKFKNTQVVCAYLELLGSIYTAFRANSLKSTLIHYLIIINDLIDQTSLIWGNVIYTIVG